MVSGGGHPIQCLKTAGKGGEEELLPRKYRSEFIVMLDISPLFWFSKKQSAIKTCSFGSDFIFMKKYFEYIRCLRYKLRMMAIFFDNTRLVHGDNQHVL